MKEKEFDGRLFKFTELIDDALNFLNESCLLLQGRSLWESFTKKLLSTVLLLLKNKLTFLLILSLDYSD